MIIEITFLGTAQAIPTAKRNHVAMLLKYGGEMILFDCGEGTQRQFRKARLNPCRLTRLCISHWHGDHVLGIPGLFQTLALSNYSKKLQIYGPEGTKEFTKQLIKPFIPVLKFRAEVHEVEGKFFENRDFEIHAFPLLHRVPCNGYFFKEKDKLRIKKQKLEKLKIKPEDRKKIQQLADGKDIKINDKLIRAKDITYKQKGKKIAFILDTKICKNTEKLAKNSDLLICEATYMEREKELAAEYKHLTAAQAAGIAKKAQAKRLILTHISQRYDGKEQEILEEAKKIFKNTEIAEDFMRVKI